MVAFGAGVIGPRLAGTMGVRRLLVLTATAVAWRAARPVPARTAT